MGGHEEGAGHRTKHQSRLPANATEARPLPLPGWPPGLGWKIAPAPLAAGGTGASTATGHGLPPLPLLHQRRPKLPGRFRCRSPQLLQSRQGLRGYCQPLRGFHQWLRGPCQMFRGHKPSPCGSRQPLRGHKPSFAVANLRLLPRPCGPAHFLLPTSTLHQTVAVPPLNGRSSRRG